MCTGLEKNRARMGTTTKSEIMLRVWGSLAVTCEVISDQLVELVGDGR